ncbi:MAG: hypothetical protein V2B13_04170 [Pseudomonadota bacterium]
MKNDAPIDEKKQEHETPKSLLEELIRKEARRRIRNPEGRLRREKQKVSTVVIEFTLSLPRACRWACRRVLLGEPFH